MLICMCRIAAGVDYIPLTGVMVTFTPGSNRQCVQINVTGEFLKEAEENFQVTAVSGSDASNTEVCITDDDRKSSL